MMKPSGLTRKLLVSIGFRSGSNVAQANQISRGQLSTRERGAFQLNGRPLVSVSKKRYFDLTMSSIHHRLPHFADLFCKIFCSHLYVSIGGQFHVLCRQSTPSIAISATAVAEIWLFSRLQFDTIRLLALQFCFQILDRRQAAF